MKAAKKPAVVAGVAEAKKEMGQQSAVAGPDASVKIDVFEKGLGSPPCDKPRTTLKRLSMFKNRHNRAMPRGPSACAKACTWGQLRSLPCAVWRFGHKEMAVRGAV